MTDHDPLSTAINARRGHGAGKPSDGRALMTWGMMLVAIGIALAVTLPAIGPIMHGIGHATEVLQGALDGRGVQ